MQGFFYCIISRRIRVNAQKSLQRRPYPGHKKFTEPVTIAACITLVSMCKKDGKWVTGRRLLAADSCLQYHSFIYFQLFSVNIFQLHPCQGIVVPVQVMIAKNFYENVFL